MDNETYRRQKSALTRAINTGDRDRIVATVRRHVAEWNDNGPWPDDWSRWERALNDSRPWDSPYLSIGEV